MTWPRLQTLKRREDSALPEDPLQDPPVHLRVDLPERLRVTDLREQDLCPAPTEDLPERLREDPLEQDLCPALTEELPERPREDLKEADLPEHPRVDLREQDLCPAPTEDPPERLREDLKEEDPPDLTEQDLPAPDPKEQDLFREDLFRDLHRSLSERILPTMMISITAS